MGEKKLRHSERPAMVSKKQPGPVDASHDKLLKFDELIRLLNLPRSTLRYYIAIDLIPSVKIGRHRRFIYEDVMKAVRKLS